jgi:hypothetical protein
MRVTSLFFALALSTAVACATSSSTDDGDTSGDGGSAAGPAGGSGGAVGGMGGDGGAAEGGAGGAGGEAGAGGTMMGLPIGADCTDDSECESQLCREVFLDLPDKLCVDPCQSQADCPTGGMYFCEAITPGDTMGYCIPRSPAHCLSCDEDSDCGYLAEACLVAPGDIQSACHVDCTLAGDDACPSEYGCEVVDVGGGQMRSLCMPNVPTCLDALGGFCDRIAVPQACSRDNAAGVCLGLRDCLNPSKRFDVCDASAPQCKATCSSMDPAGCTTSYCAEAIDGPDNCGMCGNPCPGFGSANANVTCQSSSTCTFSCQGEHYDVDGVTSTGCEVVDSPLGNHSQASAAYLGSFPCTDGSSNPNATGVIHSDTRVHELPSVDGFNTTTGATPDWFRLFADGGLCENEVVLTLTVTGGGDLACYQLQVTTNNGTYTCNTNAAGSCLINQNGSGVYSDDTDIHLRVSKTCSTAVSATVSYSVTGHL